MRLAGFALVGLIGLGACAAQTPPSGPGGDGSGYYPDPGGGSGGDPGGTYGCTADSQCGANNVCARTAECWPASEIYVVHVMWTIHGQPASADACANAGSGLEVDFTAQGDQWWGYAPVPCVEGKFTVDKMPMLFDQAQVMKQSDSNVFAAGEIDRTTGDVTVDLSL